MTEQHLPRQRRKEASALQAMVKEEEHSRLRIAPEDLQDVMEHAEMQLQENAEDLKEQDPPTDSPVRDQLQDLLQEREDLLMSRRDRAHIL